MALCEPVHTLKQVGPWKEPSPGAHCNAYYVSSSCWAPGAQQASTAATDQYCTTFDTSTTDSAVSDQDALACHELLLSTEEPFSADPQPHCARATPKSTVQLLSSSTPAQHEVRETIRNEMVREQETQPELYFKRHAFLSKELRSIAVSWAIQVVEQFRVEQEALFLAISYLDRFLSITEDVVHMDGLHLATLACLSLAAKQAEKEQLARMEWIIMENLDWRGCAPTAWWFLHLFCYGLGTCPAPSICMAAYLLELGLLEAGCLLFNYSSLAAAALMLGHTITSSSADSMQVDCSTGAAAPTCLSARALLELAPELNLHQVQDACRVLADLHARACALPLPGPEQALEGMQLVRHKYSAEMWHGMGTGACRINLQLALDRF